MKVILKRIGRILIGFFVWALAIGIVHEFGISVHLPEKLNALLTLILPVGIAVLAAVKVKLPRKKETSKPVVVPSDELDDFAPITRSVTPDPVVRTMPDVSYAPSVRSQRRKKTKPSYPTRTYKVTGVSHYTDAFDNMAAENPDYDLDEQELIDSGLIGQRVWQYEFYPEVVEVIPEPTNFHDPNAIKVVVDDELIGYIKAGSCAHLNRIISEGKLGRITCIMGGGPYKYISEDEDGDYNMDEGESRYFAELHIEEL